MKIEMHGIDEITGVITGISVYMLTHCLGIPLLQIQHEPILTLVITKLVSLFFAAVSAIIAYLAVHYTKKLLKHEK